MSTPPPPPASNRALVWRYMRPQLPSVAVAMLAALAIGLVMAPIGPLLGPSVKVLTVPKTDVLAFVELFGPRFGAWVAAATGRDAMSAGELVAALPVALVCVAALTALLGATQWYLWERCGERASLGIRKDLAAALLAVDPSARRTDAARERDAEISTAVTTDVRMLREYIVHFYGGLPRELSQTVFHAATLILLSPKLFAIFALGVAPAVAVVSRVGKKLRKRAGKALADYSQLAEWLQQRLLGIETIKHYGTEALETGKLRELTATLQDKFVRAARVKARTSPLLEAFAAVALVLVLIVALGDVAEGRASGTVLLSFFTTLALLSQSAGKLGRYLNSNREGAAAADRLRTLLTFLGERQRVAVQPVVRDASDGRASIRCNGVVVRYPGAEAAALDGLSHEFAGGRVHCVAGPSGAGKSTLLNAALGLVTPNEGEIAFHGPRAEGRLWGAYMPQKVQLAPDTIGANVAYPDEKYDAARAQAALARVGMDAVVAALPAGLEARVGEGGAGLSGGQAQRILLARLWYHQSPFVLVDEGTSALDPEVEQLVHSLLRDLAERGAVVLAVAHRRAVAEAADELVLLEQGRVVAHGPARELLASGRGISAFYGN